MLKLLLLIWAVIYAVTFMMARKPGRILARAATTWFGPEPVSGELSSRFQMRRARYAFGWLCHLSTAMTLFLVVMEYFPAAQANNWFMIPIFALPIAIGMALLALLGFLFMAAKARLIGPDPTVWVSDKQSDAPASETSSEVM